ncbi:MFS transporter [Streptomyces indicus]|uniref:Predicted arabinose efflux permease, MFS family n=1 Tax=Streptomyces indicus TaxID=417292 RepID=A0A1G9HJZ1_9ACTN|nr:MFS transporter [Streptomyces indicus]SDL12803.1 Predicted arabinose efflux permease, MFS family [Streptomyces indicus]
MPDSAKPAAAEPDSAGSYRTLLSRPVLAWSAVAVATRMPVAMAPLALVFLVRERPGGYAFGALLGAVYVIGEIAGAAVLGTRLRPERARRQLALGLLGGGAGFLLLALAPDAPGLVLGAGAFLAGAAPAGAAGGLRALLQSMVPSGAVAQALSFEAILNSLIWAVAPVAATSLALSAAPYAPMILATALVLAATAGLWLLPAGWKPAEEHTEGGSRARVLLRAWPAYVMGAATMCLLALAELALPALLAQRGFGVGLAGPLLAGFAVASAVGAFVYGTRASWPGRLATQSAVLLIGVSACAVCIAVVPSVTGIAVGLGLAGVLQAGAILTRNLALRETLPESALAAGYSVMYAAVGAGYALSGSLAGGLMNVTTPSNAVLVGVGLTLVLTAAGVCGDRRLRRDGSTRKARTRVVRAEGAPVGGRGDTERAH